MDGAGERAIAALRDLMAYTDRRVQQLQAGRCDTRDVRFEAARIDELTRVISELGRILEAQRVETTH